MRSTPGNQRRGERGQFLVLFVVIFSIILAMGAFAVDQGLAYGKHGVAQNNADSASRAGAYGCLLDLSDGTSSTCDGVKAMTGATSNASANLNASAIVTHPSCPESSGGSFPSLTAEIDKTSPSMFGKLFRIGDYTAKAIATTCVGAVSGIASTSSIASPIPLAPLWFAQPGNSGSDPNRQNCGAGASANATFAGRLCVIFSTDAHPSFGTFYELSGQCGPKNFNNGSHNGDIYAGISNGLTTFACSTAGPTLTDYYGSSSWARSILDAFANRLPLGEPCGGVSSVSGGIAAVMETLGGNPAKPTGASPPGIDDPASTIYRKQSCPSQRLVLVPLVTGGGAKTVTGFAAVYVTGCTPANKTQSDMLTGGLNECDTGDTDRGSGDLGKCQHPGFGNSCNDSGSERNTKVWGIVLRVYLAGDSVQQIGPIGNNGVGKAAALAMQTMQ